ncbi:hypothetical protein GCM10022261_05170 [Brevibacterium daeguense]|uniref:Phosphatidylglycerol lysyltransferase C-terminal domain-containing protein n=1 Tax=Brevibacterium daeguense TaxID=909936 RepID=A0ABP8EG80_9MICO|nr:phosphatidylglycerol lysyltransferase domain-containing protein [Brevibacterium daeguense]
MNDMAEFYRHDRARRVAAYLVAGLAFVGLISAASSPLRSMLTEILQVVPFIVPGTAAVTLVFVSFALLLAARGLRRGHRLAWVASLVLLLASVVLHVVKGIDIEEAVLAAAGAVWLAANHRAFPVLPSRAATTRAILVGVGGTAVTLLVAVALAARVDRRHHRDVDQTIADLVHTMGGNNSLPVTFGGPFATPVLVAIGLGALGSALWLLLSPRFPAPLTGSAHHAERERARVVVERYGGGTLDYFALRDDKQWFFTGDSLVAHIVRGGVCLVSPDPIGPPAERAQVWMEFMTYAERSGWSVTVLGASPQWLPTYEATGLHGVYLGDEAVVDCRTFTLDGPSMKSLRRAYRRVQRAGYSASFHDPAALDEDLRRELREVSTQSRRGDVERGFSMTLSRLFDPEDTGLLLSIARDTSGRVQAFVQWVPAQGIEGWSLDVMRRRTEADLPNGVMDFLITETIYHVRDQGGCGLGLNFALFRGIVAGENKRRSARAARALLRQASRRAPIESLWKFNAKYQPSWVPRYVMVGSIDTLASQGLAIVDAEGIADIPRLGRLLSRDSP